MIAAISDRDFDAVVERSKMPVLVEFWKPGCGSCLALTRQLELLDRELDGRVRIVAMNVEENFQIPSELEVESLPALALYRHGRFERFIGGIGSKDEIRKKLGLP